MTSSVLPLLIGTLCIFLGLQNMKGNISSLHSYHRHRVSEEDRLPFGKKVGLGTLIIGAGISFFGIFSALTLYTDQPVFTLIGTVVLIPALLVGIGLSIYAMVKYNKGIF